MPQPTPPPPPAAPKQGFSMFTVILILALITVGVAWYRGWLTVDKDPVTSKTTIGTHGDKFKTDRDAAIKSVGNAYTAIKDKITGKETAQKTATKPEDKAAIDKEIEALKKQLAALEEAKKKAEAATDEAGLKGLDETVKKLLENPK